MKRYLYEIEREFINENESTIYFERMMLNQKEINHIIKCAKNNENLLGCTIKANKDGIVTELSAGFKDGKPEEKCYYNVFYTIKHYEEEK